MRKPAHGLAAILVITLGCALLTGCTSGQPAEEPPPVIDTTPTSTPTPTPEFDDEELAVINTVENYRSVMEELAHNLQIDPDLNKINTVAGDSLATHLMLLYEDWFVKGFHMEGNEEYTVTNVSKGMTEDSRQHYYVDGCINRENSTLVRSDGTPVEKTKPDRTVMTYTVVHTPWAQRVISEEDQERPC